MAKPCVELEDCSGMRVKSSSDKASCCVATIMWIAAGAAEQER